MARRPIHRELQTILRRIRIDDAESMIIFDEKSPVWKTKKLGGRATFVTLKPPPDASDTLIDEIKTKLYAECGARVVNIVAKQKPLTVIEQAMLDDSLLDIRKTVLTMVDEANTQDRDALRARVEVTMAEVGL